MDIELELAVERLTRTKLEEILEDHDFEVWHDNNSRDLRTALKWNMRFIKCLFFSIVFSFNVFADERPAWVDGASRTIIGGDILHVGLGEGNTQEVARFKAEAMAVRNLISECTLAHKDTVVWDRYLEGSRDNYRAYARAGMDFKSCDESKDARGDKRKELANPVLMANQDLYSQLETVKDESTGLKAWFESKLGYHDTRLADLEAKVASLARKPATVYKTVVQTNTVYVQGGRDGYKECLARYKETMEEARRLAQFAYPPGNLMSPQAGGTFNRAMFQLSQCRKMKR